MSDEVKKVDKMKFIIWDFDGTLAHRPRGWTGALLEALSEFRPSHQIVADQLHPYLQTEFPWHVPEIIRPAGCSAAKWWKELNIVFQNAFQRGASLNEDDARLVAQLVKRHYLDVLQWEIFDDVIPALTELAGLGWKHLILSNHVPELADLVSQLKLEEYFVDVISSANTGVEKPHPDAFRRVLRTLPAHSKCWMVGDSETADIDGAHSVGIDAILVRKHHSSAKHVSANLRGVAPIVDTASGNTDWSGSQQPFH